MQSARYLQFCAWTVLAGCTVLFSLAFLPSTSWGGETLSRVKTRGVVRCGVAQGLPGLASRDGNGRWTGLEVDFCRAVAAATLGSSDKAAFVPLSAAARFPALLAGEIDLLLRGTTWTLGRESLLGVMFAGTLLYDGQAFMVTEKSKAQQVSDLNGATICLVKGTTHVAGLADYFGPRGLQYKPLVLEHLSEVRDAFLAGRCEAYTSDRSELAALRSGIPKGAKILRILPGVISKEPLGPVVKSGDTEWLRIVKWVLLALIEAEEIGITRDGVGTAGQAPTTPEARQFLGAGREFGRALGISPDWSVRIIESVGNYGEMFERNLGRESTLKLDRGMNRLWSEGGLMYAPPFR